MKRERADDDHSITMANCLMLLSSGRVFVCKTCNRQFSSFQALGGHRASHKKPRIMSGSSSAHDDNSTNTDHLLLHASSPSPPAKPKSHECSICGLEFAIGQALGGHMRRHRATTTTTSHSHSKNSSSSPPSSVLDHFDSENTENMKNKKSKRVLFLDLNLTPLENDLEILGITTSTTPLLVTL